MRIFICWSGDRSLAMAEALADWLPCVIQKLQPWMSKTSIAKGARWRDEVSRELASCEFGILCLTPENLSSEWIHFEAGAITKHIEHARVIPYLLEGDRNLRDPLGQFQTSRATKEDTFSLVKALNSSLRDGALNDARLQDQFDLVWHKLEAKILAIPKPTTTPPPVPQRSPEEFQHEMLMRLRAIEEALARLSQPENTISSIAVPVVAGGTSHAIRPIESTAGVSASPPDADKA